MPRLLAILRPLAVVLLASASLGAAETVEKYPDGAISSRYEVDASGAKSGSYASFYPDGKPREKGGYRKDLKQGKWTEYDDDAAKHVHSTMNYDKGLLNGPYALNKQGKPRLKATYAKGELTTPIGVFAANGALERVLAYPRSLDSLTAILTKLLAPVTGPAFTVLPSTKPPFSTGTVARPVLEQALHALQALRLLCGAPSADLTLDDQASDLVQHAAVLAAAKGFSHEPSQPDGMDAAFFGAAVSGTKSCLDWSNQGDDALVRSLWNWANDPDAEVHHRRFLLNPALGSVGFGFAPPQTLIDIMDASGRASDWQFISFPGQGYFPRALLGKGARWSVHPNPSHYSHIIAADIAVSIHHLDDDDGLGAEIAAGDVHLANGLPLDPTIVFSPMVDNTPQRLWVDIQLGGGHAISFVVDLVAISLPAPSALLPAR